MYWTLLYCTVLATRALHLFIFSSSVMFILFHWMFLFLRGFWFSHISLIRAEGCRTAFIATWLSKFLSSLRWLGVCTEYNTMKLQLPRQDDVASGQYAQNSSRCCWWKVTIYLSNDLVNFKTYFVILQQRRWITKDVFFSDVRHNFSLQRLMCEPSLQKIKCEWHQSEDLGLVEAVKCRRTNI